MQGLPGKPSAQRQGPRPVFRQQPEMPPQPGHEALGPPQVFGQELAAGMLQQPARPVEKIVFRATVPLIGRDTRRILYGGCEYLVDAVVKERDIRALATVNTTQQGNRLLGADIAELAVIGDLGAVPPRVQQPAQR